MNVTIKTPSRIHLGLIDLNGSLGRVYGSIGLALNSPPVVLEAKNADKLRVIGQDAERVSALVKRFCEAYNVDSNVEVNVQQAIPEHSGLGSGTQLALSVATALSYIHKLSVDVRDLARTMGRGKVSGIGIEAFKHGGFIIDAGVKVGSEGEIPSPIYRINFPKDWTFVLAIPSAARGLFGEKEESAFKKVIPASPDIAREVCRLLQMKMLPALMEKDIATFGKALMEVDKTVGLYFEGVQDGIYSDAGTQKLVESMLAAGAYGAGQRSWGPAVYGLVEDSGAQKLEAAVEAFMKETCTECSIIRTHANNAGAKISALEDA
jgi:beta-ribofuranosylaminobenzene 5'-phosphate synthase